MSLDSLYDVLQGALARPRGSEDLQSGYLGELLVDTRHLAACAIVELLMRKFASQGVNDEPRRHGDPSH